MIFVRSLGERENPVHSVYCRGFIAKCMTMGRLIGYLDYFFKDFTECRLDSRYNGTVSLQLCRCCKIMLFMPSGRRILIYPCPFVRPDIDTWFVQLSPPTVLEPQL